MFLPCWITLLGGGHRICDWLTMKDRLPPVITSYTWKTSNYIDLYSLQIVYNVYIIYIYMDCKSLTTYGRSAFFPDSPWWFSEKTDPPGAPARVARNARGTSVQSADDRTVPPWKTRRVESLRFGVTRVRVPCMFHS